MTQCTLAVLRHSSRRWPKPNATNVLFFAAHPHLLCQCQIPGCSKVQDRNRNRGVVVVVGWAVYIYIWFHCCFRSLQDFTIMLIQDTAAFHHYVVPVHCQIPLLRCFRSLQDFTIMLLQGLTGFHHYVVPVCCKISLSWFRSLHDFTIVLIQVTTGIHHCVDSGHYRISLLCWFRSPKDFTIVLIQVTTGFHHYVAWGTLKDSTVMLIQVTTGFHHDVVSSHNKTHCRLFRATTRFDCWFRVLQDFTISFI